MIIGPAKRTHCREKAEKHCTSQNSCNLRPCQHHGKNHGDIGQCIVKHVQQKAGSRRFQNQSGKHAVYRAHNQGKNDCHKVNRRRKENSGGKINQKPKTALYRQTVVKVNLFFVVQIGKCSNPHHYRSKKHQHSHHRIAPIKAEHHPHIIRPAKNNLCQGNIFGNLIGGKHHRQRHGKAKEKGQSKKSCRPEFPLCIFPKKFKV